MTWNLSHFVPALRRTACCMLKDRIKHSIT